MPGAKGAARLRVWLDKHKMTQREFAAFAQMHWSYVNHLLAGKKKPSLAVAVNLHALTGIPTDCWATPGESAADAARRITKRRQRERKRRATAKQTAAVSPEVTTDESAPV